jgi:hypothetical protein
LSALGYNREREGPTLRSFRAALRRGEAHCLEAAMIAAVMLEQHNYPPLLLSLESQDKLDHVGFLYRRKNLWGAIARSRDTGLHGRRPVFRYLRQLAWAICVSWACTIGVFRSGTCGRWNTTCNGFRTAN